jgi:hypothetical protein
MNTYKVIASQLVFYEKIVQAETQEDAEQAAWESDFDDKWREIEYSDWQLEQIREVKEA